MYRNLEAEMKRKGITQKELAGFLKKDESTISLKMSGKRGFTLGEAKEIKKILGVDIPIEVLFETDAS